MSVDVRIPSALELLSIVLDEAERKYIAVHGAVVSIVNNNTAIERRWRIEELAAEKLNAEKDDVWRENVVSF